jgi:hypothetical protein
MDLTTATPVEIDTVLADLYGQYWAKASDRDRMLAAAKEIEHGLAKLAKGDLRYTGWTQESADLYHAKAKIVQGEMDALADQMRPLNAEFTRRGGWTRFYQVPDGHIHSSMQCSTCNKNGKSTRFGWLPERSGQSEEQALEALVTESAKTILCTVCYPSAPVAWTVARVPEGQCPGSGTFDYPRETSRHGYMYGNYGICSHCGNQVATTKTGKMRKHQS